MYFFFVFFISIVGFYLVWIRGVFGGVVGYVVISFDVILILICGGLVIYYVWVCKFDYYCCWVMWLFMVVSVVWFFCIGMMFWFVMIGGVGIDMQMFIGLFIYIWYFGQMVLLLFLLEFYFWVSELECGVVWKFGVVLIVVVVIIVMLIGIFVVVVGMWLLCIVQIDDGLLILVDCFECLIGLISVEIGCGGFVDDFGGNQLIDDWCQGYVVMYDCEIGVGLVWVVFQDWVFINWKWVLVNEYVFDFGGMYFWYELFCDCDDL